MCWCAAPQRTGGVEDMTPAPFSARTRVHEYGGGAACVSGGTVIFSNFADQRLYRQEGGRTPRAADPGRRRLPLCRRAARRGATRAGSACANSTAPTGGSTTRWSRSTLDRPGPGQVLAQGHDFYASPTLSPDGKRLAWLTWDHPNMPWVGTELWLAEIAADGALAAPRLVAGGAAELIFQPQFSPDGILHFVSDRTGWWNLYRVDPAGGAPRPLCPRSAEFGAPQWVFGQSTYAFLSAGQLVCAYREAGGDQLARLDIAAGRLDPIETRFTDFGQIRVAGGQIVCRAGSPVEPRRPSSRSIRRPAPSRCCAQAAPAAAEESLRRYFSAPRHLAFPTGHGLTAYANYYPPANPDCAPPAGRKAAARRQMPWRPDRVGVDGPQPRHPVLDEPRHRRARCRLRRQHRLWPRLSRAAARAPGASSMSTIASTPPATSSPRVWPTASAPSSPAAAPAAIPCWRRSRCAMSSRAAPAITGSAMSPRWPATPTNSSRAISIG